MSRSLLAETPLYCLLLTYDAEPLRAGVAAGSEAVRRELVGQRLKPAALHWDLWAPGEVIKASRPADAGLWPADLDAPLGGLLEAHEQEGDDLDEDDALYDAQLEQRFTEDLAALNSVARPLNRLRWTEIRPVTSDFVVAAVDLETAELSDNLKQSAPAEVVAELRARGLVPHD